jgi:starch phosphorylase
VIAYFSMEIALEAGIRTYSGGLGVLAGDTVRSAADLGLEFVAVSLVHRRGYFTQRIGAAGVQEEEPAPWSPEALLQELEPRVQVEIEGRPVEIRAWKHSVLGLGGAEVPVLLLDTDLGTNAEWDRTLAHFLYGGDERYRLCQEVVLGIGGVRMLRALGYAPIDRYHMNEGHSSFLTLELLRERTAERPNTHPSVEDVQAVRRECVFTTHTPVAAGFDRFSLGDVVRVLSDRDLSALTSFICVDGVVNMTYLALNLSHYVNGVAKRHGETSRHLFAPYVIDSITNGVHLATWASPPFQALYDQHIPGWRADCSSLRYALGIPREEIWRSHQDAKRSLIERVNASPGASLDCDTPTLGFARRMTAYKRPDLLFCDLDRLRAIAAGAGGLQVVYSGKAHPRDAEGKELIRRLHELRSKVAGPIRMAFLPDYDLKLAQLLTSGADVWLNTPQPPLEASGTSGMKAAVNGVPSFSVLDGWWLEGCIEGITGWAVEKQGGAPESATAEETAHSLYDKLELVILPLLRSDRSRFVDVMRHAIALNASFFHTERMLDQYVTKAYFR